VTRRRTLLLFLACSAGATDARCGRRLLAIQLTRKCDLAPRLDGCLFIPFQQAERKVLRWDEGPGWRMVREARLRPAYGEWYPGIEAGVWHNAVWVTEKVLQQQRHGSPKWTLDTRPLSETHFEFQGGSPPQGRHPKLRLDAHHDRYIAPERLTDPTPKEVGHVQR
jgi:hypothetical protein